MAYTPTTWIDGSTPINASNLNKIEQGVDVADQAAVDAAAAAAAAQATADAAIPKALVDAKGDLIGATTDNTPARIPVGADGQVLTVDLTQPLGLKYAAPAAGGADLSYDGDWVAGTYQDGDVVVKDGVAYLCVGGPTAVAPDPAPWGAAVLAKTPYGTTLPASPVDGQEAILVDSLTAPTYQWRFRYNASRADAYKWEFIGGPPLSAEKQSADTLALTASYQNVPNGPSLTVPRAGIYMTDSLCHLATSSKPAFIVTADYGAGTPTMSYGAGNIANTVWFIGTASNRTILTAGQVLALRAKSDQGQTWDFVNRMIRLFPVAVA